MKSGEWILLVLFLGSVLAFCWELMWMGAP